MKISLLVIGDFAWDVIISTENHLLSGGDVLGTVEIKPGGSAANTAVWASRSGLNVTFAGKIGIDSFGKMAKQDLIEENVNSYLIESKDHSTESVAVWIDHNGKRSTVSGKGADFFLQADELPLELIEQTGHLYLSAWSLFTDPPRDASFEAARLVRQNGGEVSLDPASFQMIQKIGKEVCIDIFKEIKPTFLFPNYEEGKILSSEEEPEKIVKSLSEIFKGAMICLKLDAKGALVYDSGSLYHLAPNPTDAVDDTGAGDAFSGAFLAEYLKSGDAMSAGELAICVSSWVVGKLGARPKTDELLMNIIKKYRRQSA